MIHQRPNFGTCSTSTKVELQDDGIIANVEVTGGCNGNLKGIMSLLAGMDARAAIQRLKGINCGFRGTSCPDQIALALEEALAKLEGSK